jgi:hypothetical protein
MVSNKMISTSMLRRVTYLFTVLKRKEPGYDLTLNRKRCRHTWMLVENKFLQMK